MNKCIRMTKDDKNAKFKKEIPFNPDNVEADEIVNSIANLLQREIMTERQSVSYNFSPITMQSK